MGKPYYYFAASLPLLNFDSKPPMTIEVFLEDCERLLDAADFARVKSILSDEALGSGLAGGVLGQIARSQHSFRNEAAFLRAQRAGKDPEKSLRGERTPDAYITGVLQDASRATNPLEGEKIIDKAKWQYLSDIAVGHYFDLAYIVVYGLKLKILNRYEIIRSAKGREILDEIKKVQFPKSMQN